MPGSHSFLPDVDIGILNYDVVIVATLSLTDPKY